MKLLKNSLAFIFAAAIFLSCDTRVGRSGVSDDIEFSKKHNLFVQEYEFESDTLIFEDTILLIYKSIWLERYWQFGKSGSILPGNSFQLIIDLDESSKIPDMNSFNVGLTSDAYCRPCNSHCLMTNFDSIPNADTLKWPIQRECNLYEGASHDILGVLKIVKKQNK